MAIRPIKKDSHRVLGKRPVSVCMVLEPAFVQLCFNDRFAFPRSFVEVNGQLGILNI